MIPMVAMNLNSDMESLLEITGPEIFNKIVDVFGGSSVYISRIHRVHQVHDQIRQEFRDGATYTQLARKYGVTQTWVRKLCAPDRSQIAS